MRWPPQQVNKNHCKWHHRHHSCCNDEMTMAWYYCCCRVVSIQWCHVISFAVSWQYNDNISFIFVDMLRWYAYHKKMLMMVMLQWYDDDMKLLIITKINDKTISWRRYTTPGWQDKNCILNIENTMRDRDNDVV